MVINISPQVNRVIEILRQQGHSAYVVGGACRDIFMGKEIHDWDIATSALPEETKAALKDFRIIETGIKHGTVTALIDGEPIEITTYRIESGYSDNRHPDSVDFTDKIENDLSRRDFTVNAIAYSPFDGVVDPFNGQDDIKKGIIRCVGNADTRFNEDALRILRALRFSATLGFEIEKETAAAIRRNFTLLANISVERVFSEISKMLCGKDAGRILRDFSDVIFFIIPELEATKGCVQNHERHIFDVWGHTVKAVESVEPTVELRLAALFHDSGKPHAKTTDPNGIDHFYSHSKTSKKIADSVLLRFKTSNKMRNHICALVEYHDFLPDKISKKTYKKYIARLGLDVVKELFEIRKADISAQNPIFFQEEVEANRKGHEILKEIEAEEACFTVGDLKINGNDLVEIGIRPSPAMKNILETLLDEVMDGKLLNSKEALTERATTLKNRNNN